MPSPFESRRVRDYLTARGIDPETAFASEGYRESERHDLLIPLFRPRHDRPLYATTRHLDPRWTGPKFKAPKGKPNLIHVPRAQDNPRRAVEATETLWITEGPVKAYALVLRGACAVSVNGVDGWLGHVGRSGRSQPLPDFEHLNLEKGRRATIVFDSDALDNENILRAEKGLAAHLTGLGAQVSIARLPPGANGAKQGIDDFLVAHPRTTLAGLAKLAKPFVPPDLAAEPVVRTMSKVTLRPVDWVWHPYLPLRKVTLLGGHPGLGKSVLAVQIAASITRGRSVLGGCRRPKGDVLFAIEDDAEDTLKLRLNQALADQSRAHVFDGVRRAGKLEPFTLRDIEPLRKQARALRHLELLVVDPISLYLGSGVDAHRANEVRPILDAVGRLAQELHFAVLIVMHMRKAIDSGTALHALSGSVDFGAYARSALFAGRNPQDKDQRILAHAKSNLAKEGGSLAFRIDDTGVFSWDGASELTADDLVRSPKKDKGEPGAVRNALTWLEMVLGDGPLPVKELEARAKEERVKWRTVERAKEQHPQQIVSFWEGRVSCWKLGGESG